MPSVAAPGREGIAYVTGQVRRDLLGPAWDARLRRVDVALDGGLAGIEIYRLDPRPVS